MSLRVGKNSRVYASVNKSLRLPSFTELYYKGPVNIGNSELKPEESWSCETGVKYAEKLIKAHASVFYRYSFNLIDWIQTPGEKIWHTENLTRINTWGVEASLDFDFDKICDENCLVERLHASYSYLDMNKNSGDFISYYVLDYLRHNLGITANIRLMKDLSVALGGRYYSREGSYISFPSGLESSWKPVFLADAGLKWNLNPIEFKVDANNIFNTEYFDYGNISMPGFNINFGLVCNIGLKK